MGRGGRGTETKWYKGGCSGQSSCGQVRGGRRSRQERFPSAAAPGTELEARAPLPADRCPTAARPTVPPQQWPEAVFGPLLGSPEESLEQDPQCVSPQPPEGGRGVVTHTAAPTAPLPYHPPRYHPPRYHPPRYHPPRYHPPRSSRWVRSLSPHLAAPPTTRCAAVLPRTAPHCPRHPCAQEYPLPSPHRLPNLT
jgi:hypothetical protein